MKNGAILRRQHRQDVEDLWWLEGGGLSRSRVHSRTGEKVILREDIVSLKDGLGGTESSNSRRSSASEQKGA